ncbi:transcription termination/antitermination factor NusG [Candidatus Dojkabacteria bacterium]|nr:transcription termination/antitermination factor NusG [Candidatus Dojkabacteria bacterium]
MEKKKSNKKIQKKKVKKTTPKKVIKKTAKKTTSKNKDLQWFIVNAYSGHENRVATQLEARIKASGMEDLITEILVPTQDKIVVTKGKKKNVKEKIFPGYVLVKMALNNDTWPVVRNTDGVIGFVGTGKKPTPLNPEELKSIMAFTKVKQPTFQTSFSIGDAVKVVDGPFKDFVGSINEINQDKGQIKVLLSVFGRETPVVLDFLQVKKL